MLCLCFKLQLSFAAILAINTLHLGSMLFTAPYFILSCAIYLSLRYWFYGLTRELLLILPYPFKLHLSITTFQHPNFTGLSLSQVFLLLNYLRVLLYLPMLLRHFAALSLLRHYNTTWSHFLFFILSFWVCFCPAWFSSSGYYTYIFGFLILV